MSKDDLDLMFDAARRAPPEPSADFMARVLEDAQAVQPQSPAARPASQGSWRVWLGGVFGSVGGWPALAGMAAAAVTGLWIGISPPEPLIAPLGAAFEETSALSESLEFGEGFDFTQFEG